MATVTLRDIRKRYAETEVLKGIDLDIKDREFVVFVGPSGCGKSTLLRMIAGLEEITGGDLLIDGDRANDIPASDRGLAMVFQTYALYPHMTVAENMAFSLRLAGVSKAQRLQKAQEVARVLQLEHLLERKPRELSGGQRQRVAIGRALIRNPKVFLFDEPLSNLDAALRVQMRIELARLHDSLQATMIYVTHDQVEAMTLADKIVVLQGGLIEQVGSPLDLYHHPRNLFVAGFIGSPKMNFLSATVTSMSEFEGTTVQLPNGASVTVAVQPGSLAIGDTVTLGIRPEHLQLTPRGGTVQGEVLVAERLGGETYLYLQIEGGETLVVQTDGNNTSQLHDRISVQINGEFCHLFNLQGEAIARRSSILEAVAMIQNTSTLKLTESALSQLSDVRVPQYDRHTITSGIVHIGVGGFHRAHQAVYLDDHFHQSADHHWGICGVGLLEWDQKMRDALQSQDCLYTLVERCGSGRSG